jgi:hypothetical protein
MSCPLNWWQSSVFLTNAPKPQNHSLDWRPDFVKGRVPIGEATFCCTIGLLFADFGGQDQSPQARSIRRFPNGDRRLLLLRRSRDSQQARAIGQL